MRRFMTMTDITLAIFVVMSASFASTTSATPVLTTQLYQSSNPSFDYLMTSGTTDYLYFQSLRRVELLELVTLGEPTNYRSESSDFRWQLFHTTSAWDTPNGNGDRVFYEQFFFQDIGRAEYSRPVGVILDEGAYYRLSFQVANVDWLQPFHTIESGAPFITADGLFQVYGYGNPPIGPLPLRTSTYLLRTQEIPNSNPVPEPSTFLLLGVGLSGLIVFRIKRPSSTV